MTTGILLWVVFAAFLHAAWNLGSRRYRDLPGFVWGMGTWSGIWAALAFPIAVWQIAWSWLPLLCGLISGLALAFYYSCLERAYRTGDISIVYPIIRSSPLWVALIGVAFMGAQLSPMAWGGILLTLCGIFILPLGRLRYRTLPGDSRLRLSASLFAFGASLGTCIYTLSDKIAMDHAAIGPLAAIGVGAIASTSKLLFWKALNPAASVGFDWRRMSVPGFPAWKLAGFGLCAFGAYAIVIGALMFADAGRVLAVSNLSVVLGAIGGMLFFHERSDIAIRILGLLLTVAGITLLRLY